MSNWICKECGANYIDVSHQEPGVLREELELRKVKQQLAIAVEQLKDTYAICFRNRDTLLHTPEHNIIGGIERDCAIAIQQIKELDK